MVLNTIQSIMAALVGFIYVQLKETGSKKSILFSVFPNRTVSFFYALVATTSSLASPFGYASLKYVDYLTLLLAKSCKLLPGMLDSNDTKRNLIL